MLIELLAEKIQFIETISSWEEAIRKSAQPLLENNSVEPRYIDAMIKMCRDLKGYIVLADLFAMPHASPNAGAKRMDVALTILRKPVDFFGKPVNLILTLAVVDHTSHITLLQDVGTIFGDDQKITEIINAKTVEQVIEILDSTNI